MQFPTKSMKSAKPASRREIVIRILSYDSISPSLPKRPCLDLVELLSSDNDSYGGVVVKIEQPVDPKIFPSLLRASISQWRQQGKTGVWIKLPIEHANLVEATVKEGFRYHHAEPDYLMLVCWLPETTDTIPRNASHRVLVVQEISGKFKGTGVWKFPTGVVNEGEDICTAAIREVKEETGIDTEFVEVLAFRQSHKSFFTKSDLLFICMLKPRNFDVERQNSEIEAAQWMPIEDYAAQPFIQKQELFNYVAKICLSKSETNYTGFSPLATTTGSGKISYLYFNNQDAKHLVTSDNQP
ncbi:nudix hydrolase 2 [Quercus suber]|uniref:Nudix hydrolase 2 n=1 Tax=Quercus suber TaxID=58331 RepID=A0AAW0KEL0_QUESU